jgi:hypothetical protein
LGLPNILIFSALTGISFALALGIGAGTLVGNGFGYLDLFTRYVDSSMQALLTVVSSIFTIFFIFRLAKFFREVLDNQAAGIGVAILGFAGSFLVVLSPQENSHVFVAGIGSWIFGAFLVFFYRKKN